jgi:5-(carboxyamino)imidazole ribonucleotide mutase
LAQLDGLDSLLSIAQMPRGVPVATVAINGATNAGLLAARILSLGDDTLALALDAYREELATQARQQDHELPRS